MSANQLKNQHLLWRAAFGPMAENANELSTVPQKDLYKLLVRTSSKKPVEFNVASNLFDGLVKGVQDVGMMQQLTQDKKKMLRKQSVQDIKNLNLTWLSEMINSEAQMREKMSLFWHGHFACRVINIYFQQQLLNTIRENALGNFGDLLREVSKSPAMLSFLNNQQNKKQHPNENFAREVMELFTMGRGNYTEEDVKESARAFTGWGFNLKGEFVERPFLHDNGNKTFLGKTGNFDGDDIIDILLEQGQTAKFITQKIYKYFVNDKPDSEKIESLANSFYQSNYDIKKLLTQIYTSDWFYNDKNIGTHIKSPVELLVGIRRLLPMELDKPEVQLLFQRALGQILFYPPNVAGWPGGKNWIDSSALMLRMRIPQILTAADDFVVNPKDDDDTMMGMEDVDKKAKARQVNSSVDWAAITKVFDNIARENLMQKISDIVLQTKSKIDKNILDKYVEKDARDGYIKTTIVELMSTPEYQLC
ncbi:DUF1800 domain-containing protein [Ginsengibacter hankyongi]|uniref:DUF1800 domain-containing protein n=1 Tax=Ginsengibacter hankyongi TaxID=2607284 RepID=A0A5J5IMK5_9BACT|nr:DUF1800 domain-containing protein [Ginsengibacter hankyongi]